MLNSVHKPKHITLSCGFSLIELMLAMVIGLIIIGGVMSLYISTRDTQRASEDQLQLISDARFVINTISDDLRQTGYWGQADVTTSIVCRNGDATCTGSDALPLATGDCANGWYIDLANIMTVTDNLTNYAATCTSNNYKASTDVIGMHYADSTPVLSTALAASVTYIRSNYDVGGLFIGTPYPTTGAYDGLRLWKDDTRTENRKLVSNLYYVSNDTVAGDGIPSLHRVELTPGPVMTDKMLISGVVDLQFQFGIDTDTANPKDGSINAYVNAGTNMANIPVDKNTGKTDWSTVHSVKIWVLMRSPKKDRDLPAGPQTFTLANHGPVTYNDGHRYYMVSSVVNLRNAK